MTAYEPNSFWTGHPPIIRRPGHAEQEQALRDILGPLDVSSILEVGVGSGRTGALVCDLWPDAAYTGIDISTDRLEEARAVLPDRAELITADFLDWRTHGFMQKFDLVVAVEVLMHVKPEDIEAAVLNLMAWSRRRVCTVDWTQPISKPIADHNFLHDYAALGLTAVARTGLQTIHLTKV